MNTILSVDTIILPTLAILFPFFYFGIYILRNDLKLTIGYSVFIKFMFTSFLLGTLIFTILNYVTGGLASYYYVVPGYYEVEGGFVYNFNNNIGLIFQYDTSIPLIAVSLLSGLMYGAIITLPKSCTYKPIIEDSENPDINDPISKSTKTSTMAGSASATVSAIASTAVCCSTSIAAIIAPTILTIVGQFSEVLMTMSILLLVYSFISIVMPKLPK